MRNPWRFSFDRLTGQGWVADVGQNTREEVDTPIANGGNYGWRVFEGTFCTNNDPIGCNNPGNYIFPAFEYSHSGGRCSITGGYVYRGSQGTLPAGTYVYADFCSGEIFRWNGTTQAVLLDTAMNISSFGEDEAGEIYVVNLGGTVGRITSTATPCNYAISPTQATFPSAGGNGSFNVTAGAGCTWTATSNRPWITITGSPSGTGNRTVNFSVAPKTGTDGRNGAITVAGLTFTVRQLP
jgi:Viral BACON domain